VSRPRRFGWLDANLFIHVLFPGDPHSSRCREILDALMDGSGVGYLDPVTVHELTYALQKVRPESFSDRKEVFKYLSAFITLDTVHIDEKDTLLKGLWYWAAGRVDKFGDGRLRALAEDRETPVYTVNKRDFIGVVNTY